jgi:hypothetical protein
VNVENCHVHPVLLIVIISKEAIQIGTGMGIFIGPSIFEGGYG